MAGCGGGVGGDGVVVYVGEDADWVVFGEGECGVGVWGGGVVDGVDGVGVLFGADFLFWGGVYARLGAGEKGGGGVDWAGGLQWGGCAGGRDFGFRPEWIEDLCVARIDVGNEEMIDDVEQDRLVLPVPSCGHAHVGLLLRRAGWLGELDGVQHGFRRR